MAILPIIVAPDPRLKVKCKPVAKVNATVRRLMDDMLETMRDANGIGLAAPQVGVASRVIVVDVQEDDASTAPSPDGGGARGKGKGSRKSSALLMANPEIVEASDESGPAREGCLSLPEHFAEVTRPKRIKVRFLDRENEVRELDAEGLLATCIQHEMDHLDGILFVDHLSALKRDIILRKLVKTKRSSEKVAV